MYGVEGNITDDDGNINQPEVALSQHCLQEMAHHLPSTWTSDNCGTDKFESE